MDSSSKLEQARAKRLLYVVLALLWVLPSAGACWILAKDAWGRPLRIEDCVAFALLGCHLTFAFMGWRKHALVRRLEPAIEKAGSSAHTNV